MTWVEREMELADFGDKRLNLRAKTLLERFISQPTASIPTACRGWKETLAAYRFFDNAKVSDVNVLAPHIAATRQRMQEHATVLCVQDTTQLDYTGQAKIAGLGPLSYENQRGFYLHPTLAITPDRLCLGVIGSKTWARDAEHHGKKSECQNRTIEEKESYRWIEGYREVCKLARTLPDTRCVYMADREGDIYELFAEADERAYQADWLIRASHDRRVLDDSCLSEELARAPVLGEIEFKLPGHHRRSNKRVVQRLKAVRVELRPPQRKGCSLEPRYVTVVVTEEIKPPKGEEPITWILLTNLPATSKKQALEKVQWYLCRWEIEIYFRVLKSGCKIEKLQLERKERIEPALSMYMIVAWRVMYLTMLGRQCPDLPCDLVFEKEEWQAVYLVATQKAPPQEPPTINTILRMLAGFGGFLDRKCDGEPGPQTIWIGLQRSRDFVLALQAREAMMREGTCV